MADNNNVADKFNTNFKFLTGFYSGGNKKLIASHNGELTQDKVSAIASVVENQLELYGVSKGAVKKVFNIVIETLQNILIHGEKDGSGVKHSYFVVGKSDNEFTISSGNIVLNSNVDKLRKRLHDIMNYDEKALKLQYMQVLSNGEISTKGGAGLGFLTIALKSGSKLDFDFQKINDSISLFELHSKIVG